MNTCKRGNVIAFPLERSKQRATNQRRFAREDGRIVLAACVRADTIWLQEPLERVHERTARFHRKLLEGTPPESL